jgi:predicted CoA-binding protein
VKATRSDIQDFLAERTLAVVGVSRSGKGFGIAALRELKRKGYTIYPVHPQAAAIEGDACYPSLLALPGPVGGVLVVTPPAESGRVVQDAVTAGIPRVWLQQGAVSDEAVRICEAHGVRVIPGECVLMFAEPAASFHKFHRFVARLFRRLPN